MQVEFQENYGLRKNGNFVEKQYAGEIEFIAKDRNGNVISHVREHNIIKIFAKEILAHSIAHDKVWEPTANAGAGAWVQHNVDLEEFRPKYIVFGASFDESRNSLDSDDTRFYVRDTLTNSYIPITLGVGAQYDGGLINAVPIAEPNRPLKRIERVFFESSYQPSGTPLLEDDVRAINNTVVFETTLRKSEYNGFGITSNDFMTITEVALVGGTELDSVGSCECDPRDIFLTGNAEGYSFLASASGTSTISLDLSENLVDLIKEGDQIKIVQASTTAVDDAIMNQCNPYYLVMSKVIGGRDIVLDRTPVDIDGNAIVGPVGVLRDGFRIFSHRVLKTPIKKSEDFEYVVRWRVILN